MFDARKRDNMKILIVIALVIGVAASMYAGSFLVYIKMPDGSVLTHEMVGVPNPDAAGMYRFHLKGGGNMIVHASNVWIEEKTSKVNSRKGRR